MYQRILIATDGSELASKAVAHGIALAKSLNVPVCAVTVTGAGSGFEAATTTGAWSTFEFAQRSPEGIQELIDKYEAMTTTAASKILEAVAQIAKSQGVSCELVHARNQKPSEGIIATAKNKGCDLIVMASHGYRGLNRLLLGSQANEVLTHSHVPALIVR